MKDDPDALRLERERLQRVAREMETALATCQREIRFSRWTRRTMIAFIVLLLVLCAIKILRLVA